MKKLFTFAMVVFLGLQLNAQKFLPAVGIVNQVDNSTIFDLDEDGTVELTGFLGNDALWKWSNTKPECGSIDQTVSHTDDGTFSYKMTGEALDAEGNALEIYEGTIAFGFGLDVKPGDEITVRFYAKTDQLPAPSIKIINNFYKDGWGSFWQKSDQQRSLAKEVCGTFTEAGEWQEFVMHTTVVDTTIMHYAPGIRFTYGNNFDLDGDVTRENYRPVWIDDVTCTISRIGIQESASVKKTFDGGGAVKIDALGNISVSDANVFPMAFANGYDDEYGDYKTQGFNSVVVKDVAEAQAAVTAGLTYIMDFTEYFSVVTDDQSTHDANISEIQDIIDGLSTASILDGCLFYRLNNEQINRSQYAADICSAIKVKDPTHPVYMNLIINPLEVRRFVDPDSEETYIDMAGGLIGDGGNKHDVAVTSTDVLVIGNYSEAIPVSFNIAELLPVENDMVGKADTSFFASVYAGIANGAKGFIFTSDDPDALSDYAWWNDFPAFKDELNTFVANGILFAPEASWNISFPTDKTYLDWSPRTINGKNYLIVSNMSLGVALIDDEVNVPGGALPYHSDINIEVSVEGLGYNLDEVSNLVTTSSATITGVTATSFNLEMPALGYAILELKPATTGINTPNAATSVYPNPSTGNITVVLADDAPQVVTISNIAGAIVKQQEVQGSGVINIADQANGVYFVRVGSDITKIVLSK